MSGWLVGWLGGHAGNLWPNGERYGVGLNSGHIRKCPWAFDWHHQIWPWMTLRGQRSTSISFDSKCLENGDRYEVELWRALDLGWLERSKIKVILFDVKCAKNGKSYDARINGDYNIYSVHGLHFGWPWEIKGEGHNPLIRNILKTVTDTRLEPGQDFFESSHGLSIGISRFDPGWPWGVKTQSRRFGCEICGER